MIAMMAQPRIVGTVCTNTIVRLVAREARFSRCLRSSSSSHSPATSPTRRSPTLPYRHPDAAKEMMVGRRGMSSSSSKALQKKSWSPKVEAIFQKILQLDAIEVHLLTRLFDEKLGLDQAAPTAKHDTTAAASPAPPEKEQKTVFELRLTGFDAKSKIKVIKEVRAITSLGLKEAKDLVEGSPRALKNGLTDDEAKELKSRLEAVGAIIEIV